MPARLFCGSRSTPLDLTRPRSAPVAADQLAFGEDVAANSQTLQSTRADRAASLSQLAHDYLGPDCTVALEATTNTWAVVDFLKPSCAKVVASNPLKTKAIALSKHKSDRVNAVIASRRTICTV